MSNTLLDYVWEEKYRPKTLEDMILEDEVRKKLEQYRTEKQIPNLLLNGIPGTGKTTLAHIICKDILKCEYIYINAGKENGIDIIRTKITDFIEKMSFDGGIKVVFLDEASSLTPQAQDSLKSITEVYSKTCRFIFTCNELYKITPAMLSRLRKFDVKHSVKGVMKRVCQILDAENVQFDENDVASIKDMVQKLYPDIRKIIATLQFYTNSETKVLSIQDNEILQNDFIENIISNILNEEDIFQLRQFVINNELKFSKDYHSLMKAILNYLKVCKTISVEQKRVFATVLTEYLYRHSFVIDPEINCFACFIDIKNSL